MSFTIRVMQATDLPAIYRIQTSAYAGYFLETSDIIAQRFSFSPHTAWVAEREGRVCAYLIAYWSLVGKINPLNAPFTLQEQANCLYLHDLAIEPCAQGNGLGKKLFAAVEMLVQLQHINAIALISVQNSQHFWRALGFMACEVLELTQQKNLATYCDESTDAVYMLKYPEIKKEFFV